MTPDDLGSVEYVVVANDLLLALIREVEDLRGEVAMLHPGYVSPDYTAAVARQAAAYFSAPAPDPAQEAEAAAQLLAEPDVQPQVEPWVSATLAGEPTPALSEVDQARREAAAEEAAFRARVAQGEVEGDGIIDTSTWPVHELGDTGGFR